MVLDFDEVWKQVHPRCDSSEEEREHRLLFEFAGFVHAYVQAREEMQSGSLLDAHSSTLAALHHWAHIELAEITIKPKASVWRQIRRYHPGIHKLYEELTGSTESLEQRLKLVLLGCEFAMMDKLKTCTALIFRVLNSREEPWSYDELRAHPSLSWIEDDLDMLLNKLLSKGYIREVAVIGSDGSFNDLELRLSAVV